MRYCLFVLLFIQTLAFAHGGETHAPTPKILLSGSLDIGWNFKVGFTYGAHLGVGYMVYQSPDLKLYPGIQVAYQRFHYSDHHYNSIMYAAMCNFRNYGNAAFGIAHTWYNWGVDNRNKNESRGLGFAYDLNFHIIHNEASPIIGFRSFQPKNGCMGFTKSSILGVYTGYKYDTYVGN